MAQCIRVTLLYLALPLLSMILWPVTTLGEGIVIGVTLPMSGSHAAFGHMQKNSMLMAVEDVNAGNGINGRLLELDIRDSGGRPRNARAIIDHFVKDKQYAVVLGGFSSGVAAALADKCEQRRIPLIIVTGSEDAITLQDYRYVFRVSPPRSRYPSAALDYSRSFAGTGKIVIITEESQYGDTMNWTVRQGARDAGWAISGQWKFSPGERNMEAVYKGVTALQPDTIFLAAFPPESSRIVGELRKRVPDTPLFNLTPASIMAGSYAQCGVACKGVMNPSLWWPEGSSLSLRYRDRYSDRYGMLPDYHGAQAYAAVMTAAQALRNAGTALPEPVREALEGIAVTTPYGRVSFGSWSGFKNQNNPANYLVQWTGRRFEIIWPKRP